MADVFISYASEDRERARKIASGLQACGLSVWWDRNIKAGQAFDQVIEYELEIAKSVVVLWSKDSVSSEWVKNEAAMAAERGVLVPALIDNVKLPFEFRRRQTADLIGWEGDTSYTGFQVLADGIAATAGMTPPPPPADSKARGKAGFRWNQRWVVMSVAAIAAVLAVTVYVRLPQQPERSEGDSASTPNEPGAEMKESRASSSSSKTRETGAEVLTKQIGQTKDNPPTKGQLTAAADCCRIVPNAQLKSLGRIVVTFPEGSKAGGTRIDIFKADDKNSVNGGFGAMNADLIPGQYDIEIGGRPMKGIEVRASHDTKIRVGVLRVQAGSGTRVDIFEPGKKETLRGFFGSEDTGLPVGGYEIEIAGQRATVTVKENNITEF